MNAIEVSHLSKKYVLKEKQYYYTLRDSLATLIRHPFTTVQQSMLQKNEFWALKDLNFSVAEGEILGIIGHNGAGKSTLLKILSRITPPTEGTVTLRGRLGSLLEVGTGFHPELTGRENIFLNGAILGMKRAEVNVLFDAIVEFAEVSKFLDTPMKHYSSGMYMRLAFAVASHLQSEILLVDEVLAVGDIEFQRKCLGKMELIAKEGRTVLFVSHNMGIMQQLCEKSIWLDKGTVKAIGPTEKVISKYLRATEKSNRVPLRSRERSPEATLTAKIITIDLIQDKEKNLQLLRPDKKFSVRLSIEAKTKVKTGVWIAIKDETAKTVLLFSSGHLRSKEFIFNPGKTTIECSIDPTQLTSGRYSIECGLLYPQKEIVDLISDALYFNIEYLDPYNSSFDFSQRFASYHVDHEWKLSSNAER
jgi:lipopolysaccharide transport system ATP-binding protein